MLLRLSKAFRGIPACTLKEEVVDAAVQLAVQVAKVATAIALSDAVLLALIILSRLSAALALAAAELLEWRFAVKILGGHKGHYLAL